METRAAKPGWKRGYQIVAENLKIAATQSRHDARD
jgi:hypothetical protein